MEVDSTCRDKWSGRPRSREIGEGDGMRVMRVKECAAFPDLGDDRRDDARVESNAPPDRVDRHPIFGEPLGELGARASNTTCSTAPIRESSLANSHTWRCPPRHSRPDATCTTRSVTYRGPPPPCCLLCPGRRPP